jgi:hypothetical protein
VEEAESFDAVDDQNLIDQAISGRELIRRWVNNRLGTPNSVIDRFQGIYFGSDRCTTCVMVMLTERGMDDRRAMIALVRQTAADSIGVTDDELVLAGDPQLGAYGDEIVRRSIQDYFGLSCAISTLVAWICLRNFPLTIIRTAQRRSGIRIHSPLGEGESPEFAA